MGYLLSGDIKNAQSTWTWPILVSFKDGRQLQMWVQYQWGYTSAQRKAIATFEKHLELHGCGNPPSYGFSYCDEAMELFNAMPDQEKVIA